jgi:hypothetical protein
MSQQSVRQAARRAALDAQAVLRKERADRERRLEVLAVEVLTAIGERDGAVWDAERRAGEALRTMTGDEGLSMRAAADWCGNAITSREVTRLRSLAPDTPSGAGCAPDVSVRPAWLPRTQVEDPASVVGVSTSVD